MKDESTILSVGIDIGTSTTQVIFSRLTFKNSAGYFAVPHIAIVDKEVVYKSGIYTTPLENRVMIDGVRVREIVAGEFQKAGYRPEDTQTGAVIITGESARKENSEIVLQELSDFAGEFVVSTAGPDLEAIIAGKGSGARQYSVEHQCRVANLDIGGGTTNLVLLTRGKSSAKAVWISADVSLRWVRTGRSSISATVSVRSQPPRACLRRWGTGPIIRRFFRLEGPWANCFTNG